MTCESCVGTVTSAIKDLPGVAGVDVSLEKKQAVVFGSPDEVSAQAVIAAIEKAGYTASLAGGTKGEMDEPSDGRTSDDSL
jgi:Cu+-exporting ATPase